MFLQSLIAHSEGLAPTSDLCLAGTTRNSQELAQRTPLAAYRYTEDAIVVLPRCLGPQQPWSVGLARRYKALNVGDAANWLSPVDDMAINDQ